MNDGAISSIKLLIRDRKIEHLVNAGQPATTLNLWLLPPGELFTCAKESSAEDWLDDAERSKLARMRLTRDRGAMLASYALRRNALAEHFGVAPHVIKFSEDDLGRTIAQTPSAPKMWTSLSRRPLMIGFATCKLGPIGLDVETIESRDEELELLAPFLDAKSLQQVAKAQAIDASAFATAWTLTEAFAKAKGGGLTKVSELHIAPADRDRFRLSDSSSRFNARVLKPDSTHVASIAWPIVSDVRPALF